MPEISEQLRQAMRRWATGVAVVTSHSGGFSHGMTVNSLTSISLDPPYIVVTLDNRTRTYQLVQESGIFAVTILRHGQTSLAERFAGRGPDADHRMDGLDTFTLETGAPLLAGGAAYLDCQVVHQFPMPTSTLFVGNVLAARTTEYLDLLIYYDRQFHGVIS